MNSPFKTFGERRLSELMQGAAEAETQNHAKKLVATFVVTTG